MSSSLQKSVVCDLGIWFPFCSLDVSILPFFFFFLGQRQKGKRRANRFKDQTERSTRKCRFSGLAAVVLGERGDQVLVFSFSLARKDKNVSLK